jgi:hypothetical protein
MNKLDKISGIIKIKKFDYNFNNNNFDLIEIFVGALCLNLNNHNLIITNYISGILEASFLSHREIKNNIDWNSAHNINIFKKSKMWDYLQFSINVVNNHFISFQKIIYHKLNKFPLNYENLYIYGFIHHKINIIHKIKLNLIHKLFPKPLFYLSKSINSYNGSLVYQFYNNKLIIFGFTSFNHDNYTKIIPLFHLIYYDTLIELDIEPFKFSNEYIFNIPIINNTFYPKFYSNYFNLFKKNDVIIELNNNYINNCSLFNPSLNITQSIDEYLLYHNHNSVLFKIIRFHNNELIIKDININVAKFNKKFTNKIYLDINKFYYKNKIIFNSDILDNIIDSNQQIFNSDILKFINDPYYLINYI